MSTSSHPRKLGTNIHCTSAEGSVPVGWWRCAPRLVGVCASVGGHCVIFAAFCLAFLNKRRNFANYDTGESKRCCPA